MPEQKMKQLEEAYEVAAVAYARAAESFEVSTNAWRAAVMAYDLATGATDSEQFELPKTGPDGTVIDPK